MEELFFKYIKAGNEMTKMYETANHILIYTGYHAPAKHCHMAAHIIISPDDMKIAADDKTYSCKGVMIPSGVTHKIETNGDSVLVFLYDSTTAVARQIKTVQTLP